MSASLPSIQDLGRHHRALSDAHARIDAARMAGDARAKDITETAADIWLDRCSAIEELILTMPSATLGDVAVQLQAALAILDREYDGEWPQTARALASQMRRVLVSTAAVTSHHAGVNPAMMGFFNLPAILRHEYPPELLVGFGEISSEPPQSSEPDAELIAIATDYAAANAEIQKLEKGTREDTEEDFVPLDQRRYAARERAIELVARSPAALRAKASIYLGELDLLHVRPSGVAENRDTFEQLADSIARDVLAHTALATEP